MTPFVHVEHAAGTYGVFLVTLEDVLGRTSSTTVITDENVQKAVGLSGDAIAVKPGERSKSFASYQSVLRRLAARGLRRNQSVMALGGGVVGDLAGFCAATYMRGVELVQVPTSLLAMVDSSVGGKVGIDLPEGKNLVGAFHQPREVLIVPDALKTLPKRHMRNGLAEVLKYAFILDPDLVKIVERASNSDDWTNVIVRSIQLKAQVVQEDEFETTGRRAILNFGHTIGHAIEAELGYRHLLHGEAVAIGMVHEAKLGELLGITPKGTAAEIEGVVSRFGLPTEIPNKLTPDALMKRMFLDKKATETGLAFSLLSGWGECKLVTGVDPRRVQEFLNPR